LLPAHDAIGVEGQLLSVRRDPAAMQVHLLLPRRLSISQTDRYTPEPEDKGWENTSHLTASTAEPAELTQFLAVVVVRRSDARDPAPRVQLRESGKGVGVVISSPGSTDTVKFQLDGAHGVTRVSRVVAEGLDAGGKRIRAGEWSQQQP